MSEKHKPISDLSIAFLFSLSLFLVFLPLLSVAVIGSSTEAREVHIAKLMFETGDWVLPLRNGLVPSKPPLFHWLTATIGLMSGGVTVSRRDWFHLFLLALLYSLLFILLQNFTRVKVQFFRCMPDLLWQLVTSF